MKIVFAGGGSGGHFYPIIAIAEEINRLCKDKKILPPKLFFMATDPYNERALFENDIEFREIQAGKMRRYFSISNFFDLFKTFFGTIGAISTLYSIYPDVVFGKGGFSSFPTLLAAKILRIPVIIHESDSSPGRVNSWAGKFAERIAVSFEEASRFFPIGKVAHTGNPVRKTISTPLKEGAHEFLKLEENTPVILILGGSLGSQKINDAILGVLPELLEKYQIIHQTGKANFQEIKGTSDVILSKDINKNRYRPFEYLSDLAMQMSAGVSQLVISRAGSTIFEISNWGLPSLIIPIADSNGNHQVENAFNYARSGACIVIDEKNLAPHILLSEINRLMENKAKLAKMSERAKYFSRPDSATIIANEILNIALTHEK